MKTLSTSQLIERIKDRVTQAGSQRAFARAVGCSDAYISDVLNGRRAPGPKLCAALQLTIDRRFVESA